MSKNEKLSMREIFEIAIKSEIEAAKSYSELALKVKNIVLKSKLFFLSQEEEKHKKLLEDFYSKRFKEGKPEIPKDSKVPKVKASLKEEFSVKKLFEIAMEAELDAESFYSEFSEKIRGSSAKLLLKYLSNVEKSHYNLLKAEYDLVELYPQYHESEYFHFKDDMVHMGP
ncbi:MAG: ferritin family protein [Candidatus Methanofastidiosia archaeon]